MTRQIFDVLFVLTLFVPAAAVILGAIRLAVPRRRKHTGHAVGTGTAVRV